MENEKKKIYILAAIIAVVCITVVSLTFILNSISNSDDSNNVSQNSSQNKDSENEVIVLSTKTERIQNPFEENNSENVEYEKTYENEASHLNEQPQIAQKNNEQITNQNSEQNQKTKFTIPLAQNNATLLFIFDDAGQRLETLKKYMDLPFDFTVSVLPGLPNTTECAKLIVQNGRELILHQPMQALNLKLDPGPNSIKADMNTKEISEMIRKNLKELGSNVKGINNHEGSLITSEKVKMEAILEVCNEKKIYFLDSRTTTETKAAQSSLEMGVPFFERNAPYIDNEVDRNKILTQLNQCLSVANKKGSAVIICHVDKSSEIVPDLLKELYPELKKAGYKFSVPSKYKK